MKVTLTHQNNYHSSIENPKGYKVSIDNKSATENPKGASPMELVLMGLAGCSSIDIMYVFNKQKITPERFTIDVEGHRLEDEIPAIFDKIHLTITFEGDIPPAKAKRAVDLSLNKYCSVSKIVRQTAAISYTVILNNQTI